MKYMINEKRQMDLEYDLICNFIKLRKDLGLTQVEMSKECNVIREMIAVIENRKKHPQINTLIKILEPFGYTLSITKIKDNNNEWNSNNNVLEHLVDVNKMIKMSKNACKNNVWDHFADVGKMAITNDSKSYINDYKLTKYACYLIVHLLIKQKIKGEK